MNANYYFCSQLVIDQFQPEDVSKPFISGFKMDGDMPHYVAWLDYDEVEKYYKEVVEPHNDILENEDLDFWCWEVSPGIIDVENISLEDAKEKGLLREIEFRTGLTKISNQAFVIYNLSEREGLNPIELINKHL